MLCVLDIFLHSLGMLELPGDFVHGEQRFRNRFVPGVLAFLLPFRICDEV